MVRRGLLWGALMVLLLGQGPASAQAPVDFGGGPIEPPSDLTTEEEWAQISAEVVANLAQLEAEQAFAPQSAEAVSFQWPLRAAVSLTDYGYHGVSGFMDHNATVGALVDYTCGTRTYDMSGYNHQGTDFFTYPFPWLKMDNSQVEIVAAAAGTLIFKRDGQYDRQCAMTGASSNAVVIRHADGTLAHYLHMKNGSVTTKAVGSVIAVGEYLGVVGSSGSSTGPHLHFEVRNAANSTAIDPFHGDCSTGASLWAEQPAYYDSKVIAVHTGFAAPVRKTCPQQEIPNTADSFEPEDTVYFVTYYRDQLAGQQSVYRVLRPDGTVYKQWKHASTAGHYTASYWYWSMKLDQYGTPPEGTWTFDVTFEGATYRKTFNVGDPTPLPVTVIYPNGGEVHVADTYLSIWWDDALDRDVSIALYAEGVRHTDVISTTKGDGVHFWRIPYTQEPRADYRLRVAVASDPSVFDESDGMFTITAPPLTADFTAHPVLGTAPLTVTFANGSTGATPVDRWVWAFGDGLTSTLPHPVHAYTALGTYTVTLMVGAGDEEDAEVKPAYIHVVDRVWATYLPLVLR